MHKAHFTEISSLTSSITVSLNSAFFCPRVRGATRHPSQPARITPGSLFSVSVRAQHVASLKYTQPLGLCSAGHPTNQPASRPALRMWRRDDEGSLKMRQRKQEGPSRCGRERIQAPPDVFSSMLQISSRYDPGISQHQSRAEDVE